MKIELPMDVKFIIEKLQENGYKAYAVGGCIRDSLLGKIPKDWDITTDAIPSEVKEVFKNEIIIPTGEKYGTLTIMKNKIGYEVTTFRSDGNYSDGRRPDQVTFSKTLKEDVERRDFTINALAYNDIEGIVDYYGGLEDLSNKLIKCVGDPNKRFLEDALRILRCYRFAFKYDFLIDNETLKVATNGCGLEHISKERINSELCQILKFANFEQLILFCPILLKIIPELARLKKIPIDKNSTTFYNALEHSLIQTSNIKNDIYMKLTTLLHDISITYKDDKDHSQESMKIAFKILKNLKFDNNTIKKVILLIEYHEFECSNSGYEIRKLLSKIGKEAFNDYIAINMINSDNKKKKNKIRVLCEEAYDEPVITIKDLEINGNDLIKLGYNGKEIGKMFNKILDYVILFPYENNKENLIKKIKNGYLQF